MNPMKMSNLALESMSLREFIQAYNAYMRHEELHASQFPAHIKSGLRAKQYLLSVALPPARGISPEELHTIATTIDEQPVDMTTILDAMADANSVITESIPDTVTETTTESPFTGNGDGFSGGGGGSDWS